MMNSLKSTSPLPSSSKMSITRLAITVDNLVKNGFRAIQNIHHDDHDHNDGVTEQGDFAAAQATT